ncbi:hypothetical protein UFOVP649_45 [uncultured Caudovirales phage]|uniref:Uncharacterized protein n=1 Tax=uncultured Caudovirales phage TaxID=2100421 RepID=A0A6J5NCM5_9CAUD|nr:hypothetical protein UFOVP649_45 [uncultured Caudovirales phage]
MSSQGTAPARVPHSVPDRQALQYFVTLWRLPWQGSHTVSRVTFRNIGPPTIRSVSLASLATIRHTGTPNPAK